MVDTVTRLLRRQRRHQAVGPPRHRPRRSGTAWVEGSLPVRVDVKHAELPAPWCCCDTYSTPIATRDVDNCSLPGAGSVVCMRRPMWLRANCRPDLLGLYGPGRRRRCSPCATGRCRWPPKLEGAGARQFAGVRRSPAAAVNVSETARETTINGCQSPLPIPSGHGPDLRARNKRELRTSPRSASMRRATIFDAVRLSRSAPCRL